MGPISGIGEELLDSTLLGVCQPSTCSDSATARSRACQRLGHAPYPGPIRTSARDTSLRTSSGRCKSAHAPLRLKLCPCFGSEGGLVFRNPCFPHPRNKVKRVIWGCNVSAAWFPQHTNTHLVQIHFRVEVRPVEIRRVQGVRLWGAPRRLPPPRGRSKASASRAPSADAPGPLPRAPRESPQVQTPGQAQRQPPPSPQLQPTGVRLGKGPGGGTSGSHKVLVVTRQSFS